MVLLSLGILGAWSCGSVLSDCSCIEGGKRCHNPPQLRTGLCVLCERFCRCTCPGCDPHSSDEDQLESFTQHTNDEYYFSIPDHEKLENFMSTRIFPKVAHEDPSTDDVGTEPRNDGTALKDWLVSSAATLCGAALGAL